MIYIYIYIYAFKSFKQINKFIWKIVIHSPHYFESYEILAVIKNSRNKKTKTAIKINVAIKINIRREKEREKEMTIKNQ